MIKTLRQLRHKALVEMHKAMRRLFHFLGPTVGANAVIEQDGHLLLIHRAESGKLDVPGGLVHWGETVEQACQREVLEETGYRVELTELIGVYSWVRPGYCNVSVSFVGKVVGGEIRSSSEGQPVWVAPPLDAKDFHLGMERFVLDYLAGKRCVSGSNLESGQR